MTELTQLERARAVVDAFVPQDKPGSTYVYIFLGKATYDATQYEFIDGFCLASRRVWHLDESQTDCVAYVGEGSNGRLNYQHKHPFVPASSKCRVKLFKRLSKRDAQELERLLIVELGCLLDNNRIDGCLANIKYYYQGPRCCRYLEATYYKLGFIRNKIIEATSVETVAMNADKTIIATGSMGELTRRFGLAKGLVSACCLGKRPGVWSLKLSQAIYFCKAAEYQQYQIIPMALKQCSKHRILLATKIDSSNMFVGTAQEIQLYAPEIKQSGKLHQVARGSASSTYGWTARYVDELANELEAPVATCGPNLSGFF